MHETRLAVRWPDFDPLGHVNHSVLLIYLDEARDDLLRSTVGDFETWPNVLVHLTLDFEKEIRFGPREVIVRSAIVAVGRSSVTFEQQVLASGGDVAVSSQAVLVAWDSAKRHSRPITERERTQLLGDDSAG